MPCQPPTSLERPPQPQLLSACPTSTPSLCPSPSLLAKFSASPRPSRVPQNADPSFSLGLGLLE